MKKLKFILTAVCVFLCTSWTAQAEEVSIIIGDIPESTGDTASDTDLSVYAPVISQYESTYGTLTFQDTQYSSVMYTGVFLLDLVDFDQDGSEELVIGYSVPYSYGENSDCGWTYLDVWQIKDGSAVLAYEGAQLGQSDVGKHSAYTQMNGAYYLLDGWDAYTGSTDISLLELVGGEFVTSRTIFSNENGDEIVYMIDGVEVDAQSYESLYNSIVSGYPYYYHEEYLSGCFCGNIYEGSTYTADTLLAAINETKELVGATEDSGTDLSGYAEIIRQYIDEYGYIGYSIYYQNQETQTGETYMYTGLCLLQPIDFDGDGSDELLVGYGKAADDSTGLTEVYADVWGMDGDTPVLLYAGASFPGESYFNAIAYKQIDGVWYLYDGYSKTGYAQVSLYRLTDGSFEKAYTLEASFSGDLSYSMNGSAISVSDYVGYVSEGLTEFYAQAASLDAFEETKADLETVCAQIGIG